MKFGLNFFPSFRPSDYSTAEYFAQCLRLAERADRLGFHSVKAVEHYFYDYGGHSPNPGRVPGGHRGPHASGFAQSRAR